MNFVLQPWHLLLTILAGLINCQQQEILEYLQADPNRPVIPPARVPPLTSRED